MNIRIATTDAEISAFYPAMQGFFPCIGEEQFFTRVAQAR